MKIKLLKPHGNYKAGQVWDCPWRAVADRLIRDGAAESVEAPAKQEPPKRFRRK